MKKIIKLSLFGVSLIILIIVISLVIIDLRQRNNLYIIKEQDLFPFIRNGDVICRQGDRVWSLAFKEFSPNDKRFSHLGIVLMEDDAVFVIHAEWSKGKDNDKVRKVPLDDFLQHAQSIGIYRNKAIEGKIIADTALQYINRPFDWDFDMNDESKLYCSELLYVIMKSISQEIKINTIQAKAFSKNIIPVDICSDSEYFMEVAFFGK